jgi:hypothetical protein
MSIYHVQRETLRPGATFFTGSVVAKKSTHLTQVNIYVVTFTLTFSDVGIVNVDS